MAPSHRMRASSRNSISELAISRRATTRRSAGTVVVIAFVASEVTPAMVSQAWAGQSRQVRGVRAVIASCNASVRSALSTCSRSTMRPW